VREGGSSSYGQDFVPEPYLLLSGSHDPGPILSNRLTTVHRLGKWRFLVSCVLGEKLAYCLGVTTFPGEAITFQP